MPIWLLRQVQYLIGIPFAAVPVDLSKATKLKGAEFRFTSYQVQSIKKTLDTIKPYHRDLERISIHLSISPKEIVYFDSKGTRDYESLQIVRGHRDRHCLLRDELKAILAFAEATDGYCSSTLVYRLSTLVDRLSTLVHHFSSLAGEISRLKHCLSPVDFCLSALDYALVKLLDQSELRKIRLELICNKDKDGTKVTPEQVEHALKQLFPMLMAGVVDLDPGGPPSNKDLVRPITVHVSY